MSSPVSEALTFRTGANEWVKHDAWPPKQNVIDRQLYFHAGGKLVFRSTGSVASLQRSTAMCRIRHVRSPIVHVRSRWAADGRRGWSRINASFIAGRRARLGDRPARRRRRGSGKIVANLFASTSGSDSDWIVKLIDVYAENYRGRSDDGRLSTDDGRRRLPRPVSQAASRSPSRSRRASCSSIKIAFPANDHVFRKGHRIMVQVQSTWFPVIDRNPQRFVRSIFLAKPSDFRPATQRVFRSGSHASHVTLPIVEPGRAGRVRAVREPPRRAVREPPLPALLWTFGV